MSTEALEYYPVERGKINLPGEHFAKEIAVVNRLPLTEFLDDQVRRSLDGGLRRVEISVAFTDRFESLVGSGLVGNLELRQIFTDGVVAGVEIRTTEPSRYIPSMKTDSFDISGATYVAWKVESPSIDKLNNITEQLQSVGVDIKPVDTYNLQTLLDEAEIRGVLDEAGLSNIVETKFEDWRSSTWTDTPST